MVLEEFVCESVALSISSARELKSGILFKLKVDIARDTRLVEAKSNRLTLSLEDSKKLGI